MFVSSLLRSAEGCIAGSLCKRNMWRDMETKHWLTLSALHYRDISLWEDKSPNNDYLETVARSRRLPSRRNRHIFYIANFYTDKTICWYQNHPLLTSLSNIFDDHNDPFALHNMAHVSCQLQSRQIWWLLLAWRLFARKFVTIIFTFVAYHKCYGMITAQCATKTSIFHRKHTPRKWHIIRICLTLMELLGHARNTLNETYISFTLKYTDRINIWNKYGYKWYMPFYTHS